MGLFGRGSQQERFERHQNKHGHPHSADPNKLAESAQRQADKRRKDTLDAAEQLMRNAQNILGDKRASARARRKAEKLLMDGKVMRADAHKRHSQDTAEVKKIRKRGWR